LKAGALLIGSDAFFNASIRHLAELSRRHLAPAIHEYEEFVSAGRLMSFGGSIEE
jgi:hypothetical protein